MPDPYEICPRCGHEMGEHSFVLNGCSAIVREKEGGAVYCRCGPIKDEVTDR